MTVMSFLFLEPIYFLSGENKRCSDTKDIVVNNLKTCKVAVEELGKKAQAKKTMTTEVNDAKFAEGCYLSSTLNKGYFNKHCVDPAAKCKPTDTSAKLEDLKFSFQVCIKAESKTSSGQNNNISSLIFRKNEYVSNRLSSFE